MTATFGEQSTTDEVLAGIDLSGKRVLVTGVSAGLGVETARALAAHGAQVVGAARDLEKARRATEVVRAQAANGGGIELIELDLASLASVRAAADALVADGRPFDVVIANAGGGPAAKLRDTTLAQWNDTLAVTLTGTFLTFRAALNGMQPGGRLIAIASTASLKGGAAIAAYASAKHGVLGLVRSVAQEVAKQGITCNAICPGFVDTPLAQGAIEGLMAKKGLDRAKAEAMVASGNPIGGLIRPDEVASAALYLASPEARMINGHALSLSGGEI